MKQFTLIWLLGVALLGCGSYPLKRTGSFAVMPGFVHDVKNLNAGEICKLISSIPPWSNAKFSETDWHQIVFVAKTLQAVDTNELINALAVFDAENTNNFHHGYLESSKPFLLFRVMFALPEHARGESPGGPGWITGLRDLNPDGSVNLDFPIIWRNGRPLLISEYIGYEGMPYRASLDYIGLSSQYTRRELTRFSPTSKSGN